MRDWNYLVLIIVLRSFSFCSAFFAVRDACVYGEKFVYRPKPRKNLQRDEQQRQLVNIVPQFPQRLNALVRGIRVYFFRLLIFPFV